MWVVASNCGHAVIGRAGVKAKRIGIYKFNRIKFSQHFASAIVVSSVRLTFIWALTNIRVMFMRTKCKMINVPFMLQKKNTCNLIFTLGQEWVVILFINHFEHGYKTDGNQFPWLMQWRLAKSLL